jgi:hypothetical protein
MKNYDQPVSPGSVYTIPVEGSLGLLALGAKGVDLWRKKKEAVKQQLAEQTPPAGSTDEKK